MGQTFATDLLPNSTGLALGSCNQSWDGYFQRIFLANCTLQIFGGSTDPTTGAGITAPTGSLYLRTNGTIYVKTGTTSISWTVNAGNPLLLQTNGTNNGSQATLNLQQGTNITLTDNGSGTVTVSASGGAGVSAASVISSGNPIFRGPGIGSPAALIPMAAVVNRQLVTAANEVWVFLFTLTFQARIAHMKVPTLVDSSPLQQCGFGFYGTGNGTGGPGALIMKSSALDIYNCAPGGSSGPLASLMTPATNLAPGQYWFAQTATTSTQGNVVALQLGPDNYSIFDADILSIGTATNTSTGGVLPATMGGFTPTLSTAFANAHTSLGMSLPYFFS